MCSYGHESQTRKHKNACRLLPPTAATNIPLASVGQTTQPFTEGLQSPPQHRLATPTWGATNTLLWKDVCAVDIAIPMAKLTDVGERPDTDTECLRVLAFLHLIFGGRISHWAWKFAHPASAVSQLVLGSPSSLQPQDCSLESLLLSYAR